MAQLNDFMTRIDLSVLSDYITGHGKSVAYAKGERIVQQGYLCRYRCCDCVHGVSHYDNEIYPENSLNKYETDR